LAGLKRILSTQCLRIHQVHLVGSDYNLFVIRYIDANPQRYLVLTVRCFSRYINLACRQLSFTVVAFHIIIMRLLSVAAVLVRKFKFHETSKIALSWEREHNQAFHVMLRFFHSISICTSQTYTKLWLSRYNCNLKFYYVSHKGFWFPMLRNNFCDNKVACKRNLNVWRVICKNYWRFIQIRHVRVLCHSESLRHDSVRNSTVSYTYDAPIYTRYHAKRFVQASR